MKLLALDGNSLTYRAFFALPTDMATASGQVTNAVYGFTSMLTTLMKDQRPDGVVVVFGGPLAPAADHAERALRAAVAVQRALRKHRRPDGQPGASASGKTLAANGRPFASRQYSQY